MAKTAGRKRKLNARRRGRRAATVGRVGFVLAPFAGVARRRCGARSAMRALRGAGVRTLSDVERYGGGALARLHGVGPKALRILNEALAARRSSTGG